MEKKTIVIEVEGISKFAKEHKDEYPYMIVKKVGGSWWYHGLFSSEEKADLCVKELESEYGIVAVVVKNA